jgi:hypothetical protein
MESPDRTMYCHIKNAMKYSAVYAIVSVALIQTAQAAQALTLTLFDASQNTLPSQQGWFAQIPSGVTQSIQSGNLVFNTSGSNSFKSGYVRFRPWNLAIPLNRATGYTFSLDVQLAAESHSTNDRAGFNVVLVSSDRKAIELDFWTSEIWALKDAADGAIFTHGEGFFTNTSIQMRRYDVVVKGEQYCLFADGKYGQPALKGRLRDYSSFGFPYSQANFAFVGDNTTSASATVNLKKVSLSDVAIATCPNI